MTILTDGIYTVTSACVYVLMVVVVYCEVLCVVLRDVKTELT